jgi:hypothetical protein
LQKSQCNQKSALQKIRAQKIRVPSHRKRLALPRSIPKMNCAPLSLRPRPHQHLVTRRVRHAHERTARRDALRLQRAELGRVVAVQHALKGERLLEVQRGLGRRFFGRF